MTSLKAALLAASMVAIAAPQAASAADITFTAGAYAVAGPVRTAPGTYTDTYTFDVTNPAAFSGSLTTQRLRNPAPAGPIVSDLDFISVMLMGPGSQTYDFAVPLGGTDTVELVNLTSTPLTAGNYTLTVNYSVDPASSTNGASYGGVLNLAESAAGPVPEPATWATMLAGFGMVGFGMRRRRTARLAA